MIRFACDYAEGAHPKVLEAICRTNSEQSACYGEDEHCAHARTLIREACGAHRAEVQFLVGGTQVNFTIITAALRPWQGVLCADSGHIAVHETGAVEACGHKVLTLPGREGKITAEQAADAIRAHREDENHEHMVQPGMVYLSNPTEYGTLYSRQELEEFRAVCSAAGIVLYVDGARMGFGLAAEGSDLTLEDYARLCDAFTIGGTKVGALFGEAAVIPNPALAKNFRYLMKQKGAMLAKGRLLGVQYEALFTDGLYLAIGAHADTLAVRIRGALTEKGIPLLFWSETNQQFPIFTSAQRRALEEKYAFSFWEQVDEDRCAMRICTSWATREEDADALVRDIRAL